MMDIDGHTFLGVHMVEFQMAKGKMKVLTSAKAKEGRLVNPKVQISVTNTRRSDSSVINKRADIRKVRLLGLVPCALA